ncbi:MAG: DUF655 domain-containing protein [Candidatus Diapherotrites archaeon]|uniref:DUF655 domain-containing protein n=1 Tax=Candidatus Iainarchaeum sp. TaxID=3101447 RepID=A0A7J4IYJ2_9ARCH|nr:DUF655 domain-containing protein [Candidatus Diapherotrites archaeon]HIH08857.1 DUF655 domain-containing protein [Candidatus Diapherotrites archaeon]
MVKAVKVEEYALVLDFLPRGKSSSYKSEPIAQVLGTEYFTLLEVVPKEGVTFKAGEKVYVGKEERDKIDFIKKRISFSELTANSSAEIEKMIEKLVLEQAEKFVGFFNNAQSISLKRHQLELLPGLGKKHMVEILGEREKQQFKSFDDIEKRVHLMPNPVRLVVKRIMEELEGDLDKHFLFVRPPAVEKPFRREFRRRE